MTAKVCNYANSTYIRDYTHDLAPQTDLLKRMAVAAAPFLSLHPSFRYPTSIAMGSLRIANIGSGSVEAVLHQAVAIAALAASFLQHRSGMVLTTLQDLVMELNTLRHQTNWEESSKSAIKILNHLVYLALMAHGGLELAVVSNAIQTVLSLIQSRDEFKKDRWLEAAASLLMGAIRAKQTHTQYQQLERKWEIEEAIKRIYVGELHEKWRFPSDHLPVGVEVNGVRIISWNVLNNDAIDWVIEKDSQGLNGSLISDLNVKIQPDGLTKRDVVIVEMIQNMMAQGHVIALQECGKPFLKHLETKLSSDWQLVKSSNTPVKDQNVVLYNMKGLDYSLSFSETPSPAYSQVPPRPLQHLCFTDSSGKDLHLINAHLPGKLVSSTPQEFAKFVTNIHQTSKEGAMTIALGDHNFERDEMVAAYQKAGLDEFSFHSPWKTNVDPTTKDSKGIDHVFIGGNGISRDLQSQEILSGYALQQTIDLLNGQLKA